MRHQKIPNISIECLPTQELNFVFYIIHDDYDSAMAVVSKLDKRWQITDYQKCFHESDSTPEDNAAYILCQGVAAELARVLNER